MQDKLPIADALSFSWEATKRYFWTLFGIFGVLILIQIGAGVFVVLFSEVDESIASIFSVLFNLIYNVVVPTGTAAVALKVCDGQKPVLADLFCDLKTLGFFFLELLLLGSVLMVGFLLFIVPGVYMALRLSQCVYYIVEQKNDPIEAVKNSWEATRGMALPLLGYFLLSGVLVLGGFLLLVVGIIPAWFVVTIASAYLYRVLNQRLVRAPAPQKDPSTPPPILVQS